MGWCSVFQKLVSHNEDINRLVEKGYAVAFDNGYLIVRDIPYLDNQKALKKGAIVSKFIELGNNKIRQDDHQIFFAGGAPHSLDGKPIPNLGGGTCGLTLGEAFQDVKVERSFSNKPKSKGEWRNFVDFFEKIESYVSIISAPAIELHKATPLTFNAGKDTKFSSVFNFNDTLTSRAEIGELSAKLKDDVIAIIGLGGTGAFVLDFLVRTPVREIRGFDNDLYHVHTAFRSPGRLQEDELGESKADVYKKRYENFRSGLSIKKKFIDLSAGAELKGVNFAFVCVDNGDARAEIFNLLISMEIPFIDVGMGLDKKHGAINGMMRMVYYSTETADELRKKGLSPLSENSNNIYKTNIQIGELNALNACLAVIKFKQIRGFYHEESATIQALFEIADMKIVTDGVPDGD